jgi:hypothetical protein
MEISQQASKRGYGFWTPEKVLADVRDIVELNGEQCLRKKWLEEHGYSSLANRITKFGGFNWVRKELGYDIRTRSSGFWSVEATIERCSELYKVHGAKAINQKWLQENEYSYLVYAINCNGGFPWVRSELGIAENTKPRHWWTAENTVIEARAIFNKHGEKAIEKKWLHENDYWGLAYAIYKHGGYPWIREALGIAPLLKPRGYWDDINNLIEESRVVVDQHGPEALTKKWLSSNGYSSLSAAMGRNGHGGILVIRERLGLPPRLESKLSIRKRREINLELIREVISDLCVEGVDGFTPAQLIIPMQQAGFDRLPIAEGKDIYLAVTNGSLLPEELFAWSKGDDPEPPITTVDSAPSGEPFALRGFDDSDPPIEFNAAGGDPVEPGIAIDSLDPSHKGEPEPQLRPLALMDPNDQLRFLDAEIFASADAEAIEALISMALHQLWAKAYLGDEYAAEVVQGCQQYDSKRPWSKRLQGLFLTQYEQATALQLPKGFNYKVDGQLVEPRLMQRHVAALALERRRLLVMSDMGTGKSLAAQLAVMADGAQRVLVIAINSCVAQWVYDFEERWRGNTVQLFDMDSIRALTAGAGSAVAQKGRTVWVIPSHLLSLMKDQEVAAVVDGLQPDAVILDEIHIFKQREEANESQRRQQTLKLLTAASDLKPEMMVLGLSGTVITNSLNEGRTLLELVMGEERPDLPTGRGIAKAMRMHQALMANGIRQRATNDFPFVIVRPEVDATQWLEDVRQALRYPPRLRPLQVEKALIHARIPAILDAINGPTVVVTQYVAGFIEPLRKAIKAAGHRVGVHTGEEKLLVHGHANAVEAFKAGALDVLLASINTVSTGVDGLQNVSNNLVIACMPWTAADYLQVIARLARSGQDQLVRVVIPTTHINYDDEELGPAQWSFCGYRASIIACKQRLMDAVMDGLVPESEEITEAKAGQQLVKWLERLNTTGALVRPSRPIRVPLVFDTEEEEQKARARFGTWSSCNGRWNSQTSSKLHQRLQANPQEWELYHTDLETLRTEWDVDPLQEAIKHCSMSQGLVIGDFGCGTAKLAEAVEGRHTVHSFDHIAINDKVVACDVAAGVPLPDESLDLAIFSLSLMGSNWRDQLVEAWRCLKPTGQVRIWTAPSNTTQQEFCDAVERAGFKVITSEAHYKWLHVWGVRTNSVELAPFA